MELQRCIKILANGGLIVAPTDTVYGLVCDAKNEKAVRKLIAVKNRPVGKPISVFVDGFEMIRAIVDTGVHEALLSSLLPGPFTVILPSRHMVSPLLESERKTLGVRLPAYSWIQKLVHAYGSPLTATSANISGRPVHYDSAGFMRELSLEKKEHIDYVVDGGKLPRNKPSTIVDLIGESVTLLRKGDLLPTSQHTFTTNDVQETKKVAFFLAEKYITHSDKKPVVFLLEGDMGVGKTVFAQGLGEYLGSEPIISPSYVIYYEYPVNKKGVSTFLHADLFNIEETEEFSHLGIEGYFNSGTVLCIEWGNKIGPLFEVMRKKAKVVVVDMKYLNEHVRTISVNKL